MYKLSIGNLFLSVILIFYNLMTYSFRDQPYPTPETHGEALYNMFLRDNKVLILLLIYLILSIWLFIYSRNKRNKHFL